MEIIVFSGSMPAKLVSNNEEEVVIEVRIPKSRVFLECEEQIQDEMNDAGKLATEKCLEDFDSDGSPITVAGRNLTAKRAKVSRNYETPFGAVPVERYVYQSSQGGQTYIPLEYNARMIGGSTPRFAKIVSFKYGGDNAGSTREDVWQSHRLNISRCFIQNVSAAVAAQVRAKEEHWSYAECEPLAMEVSTIAIGLDGSCLLYCDEGHRQAMVGTIAFFDAAGERLHTLYVAAAPEHGKATFLKRLEKEIARVKERYRDARYVGISDGATDYLPWLKKHTTTQILDFWHVSEYLNATAVALYRRRDPRQEWIDDCCHRLKHEHGAATQILGELEEARTKRLGQKTRKDLEAAISYFENNLKRMNYASFRKSHLPIGSGITEAACKTIVKQRMCGSSMQWRESGADDVLILRALRQSDGHWEQFWRHLVKYGTSKPTKS